MSASNGGDVANRLQATTLSGISSSNTLLVMAWLKRDNSDLSATHYALELGVGGANTDPNIRLFSDSGPVWGAGLNSMGVTWSASTLTHSTWTHIAAWYEGWDNTSNVRAAYRNGTEFNNANNTLNNPGQTLDTISLFNRDGWPSGPQWLGRIAEVAIFSNITSGQRDTILTEAQTISVGGISIAPTAAWPLLTDATASHGGVNLTATGTVTYDAGDHPSVSSGASSARRRTVVFV